MKLIIKLFGVLMLIAGISLLVKPESLIGWIEDNMQSTSLYIFAIAVRFVFGILFIMVASESRFPVVFKVLGYLFIIAAIVFIFIGQERFIDFISSVIPHVDPYARVASVFVMAFGGFLIYAFSGNKKLEQK